MCRVGGNVASWWLVFGRPLCLLDRDYIEWDFPWIEPQADLFKGIGKNDEVAAADCGFSRLLCICASQDGQLEVKLAIKAGPIDDRLIDPSR